MRVIYKYQIPVAETCTLELPRCSEIIRVEDVEGLFYVWALVDNSITQTETRYLELYKTGQEVKHNKEMKYLGFCKIYIGMELGLYVFEITENNRKIGF